MRSYISISLTTKLGLCLMALSLSGCGAATDDGRFFQNLAERLTEIEIEEKPKDIAVQTEDVPLEAPAKTDVLKTAGLTVVDMALDMARKGDVPPAGQRASELIRIVNPLDMPRPDADTILDTGLEAELRATSASVSASGAAQVLAGTQAVNQAVQKPAQAVMPVQAFKTIQIGSFSTEDRALKAWQGLQARYPDMERLKPVMQPVTLASGATVVRLRLGPVENDAQAKQLCMQLDITDSWCAKAG